MSDRIFGLVTIVVALAYIASATAIQSSFLTDPVGPRTFPYMIGGVAVLSALAIALRPDEEPHWPRFGIFLKIAVAVAVLVAYALTIRPWGFLIPTALAAGVLSYQIEPRKLQAAITGLALSAGLYIVFKYALGLGLFPFPKSWLV